MFTEPQNAPVKNASLESFMAVIRDFSSLQPSYRAARADVCMASVSKPFAM